MATYLDSILDWHRERAEGDTRNVEALLERAREMPPSRSFETTLRAASSRGIGVAVIAEIKRRSPSRGELVADLVAADMAQAYERGGAACLSVLTDGAHFGGSAMDLMEARAATSAPVLRKDFTVDEVDAGRAERLAKVLPDSVLKVAESGIDGPAACRRLADAGFAAVLVGEHLVRSDDPAGSLRSLIEA